MSNIIPFKFENTSVRFEIYDKGNFIVVAKDIAEILDYDWDAHLLDKVPEEWKGMKPFRTIKGSRDMSYLTEQGLYFFLGRSDKPKALPFQKWIYGEVLPSIRKTGSYSSSTDKGRDAGGIYKDTGKRHNDGTPVKQLFWPSTIINLLKNEISA